MDNESVVEENVSGTEQADMATEQNSELEEFNYTQYTHLIPESVRESIVQKLTTLSFGWKRRARLIKNMAGHYENIAKLEKQLIDLETSDRTYTGHRIESNRDRLRNFFKNASEDDLQKYCVKLSVSFESFAQDRTELIEALCDEMEAQG